MIKKYISILLCLFTLLSVTGLQAFAADGKIRMADLNLPDVNVEVSGRYKNSSIEEIMLGEEKLKKLSVEMGEKGTKVAYVLVDTSTSMVQGYLDALKPSLISFAKSFDKNHDKFILMTFGEKVITVLKGGEKNSEIEKAINSIRCDSENTTFYNALSKAYKDADKQTSCDRKYAIVISDGADLEKGSNSQQEIVDKYKSHRLPVYGLCPSYASKENMDGFGYIARNSGGDLWAFDYSDAAAKFDKTEKAINDVTVIKALSVNKKSGGTKKLTVKVKDEKYTLQVPLNAKNDSTCPEVLSTEYLKDTNCIRITFSEDVDNADKISSYEITKGDKALNIVSISYKSDHADLYMEKTVYSGKYKISLSDITDSSDNANEPEEPEYTVQLDAVPVVLLILKIVGLALIPVAFLGAIAAILLFMKKKKKVTRIRDIFIEQVEEEEREAIHVKEKKGISLRLCIDSTDGTFHQMTYNLISSIIVGRSDMCDLRIDDMRMSKQHFAIEKLPNGIAITDLNSANGTFVNGIRIESRTFLKSEDRISAGNSVVRVIYSQDSGNISG